MGTFKVCPGCQTAVPEGSRFCSQCGAPQSVACARAAKSMPPARGFARNAGPSSALVLQLRRSWLCHSRPWRDLRTAQILPPSERVQFVRHHLACIHILHQSHVQAAALQCMGYRKYVAEGSGVFNRLTAASAGHWNNLRARRFASSGTITPSDRAVRMFISSSELSSVINGRSPAFALPLSN